jgi:hypothetical protein
MKISYGITVSDEFNELQKLISHLIEFKREEDEIRVLVDVTKTTNEILSYLFNLGDQDIIKWRPFELRNNFADFKNKLNSMCNGDYIFSIDADEIPNEFMVQNLHNLIEQNPTVDLFFVPRINLVEGITEEDIKKWGWNMNEKGWINFSDYQTRIYKNSPGIEWVGKVHEKIIGIKNYSHLPAEEWWCLLHVKTIEKQRQQNKFYETL